MKKTRAKKGRSFESLDKSHKIRGRREKSLSLPRDQKTSSRESSVSSTGREVRCACQYYMSDSLLPERVSLFGSRPPSRNSNLDMARTIGDHEYEPINPPPQPLTEIGKHQGARDETQAEISIPENEKHFVRIPLDNELIVQDEEEEEEEDVAMAEDSKSPEDMEVERIAAAQELQDQLENRYLAPTPTTTISQSRTDCDVNTSMLDSSGLEDLPLNRGSRNKKAMQSKTELMRAQAHGIHQKLRSQAGKLRNKLRSIPKPSFNLKERQKTNAPQEKPKSRTTERPKFSLPERPKFNLPERPKFKFPERPKFNLPERPKINLPSFGRSKSTRERQQSLTANAGSRKNLFEFDFKTYPKIFSKKSRQRGDYLTSSPKQTRGNTPPPTMRSEEPKLPERKKVPVGQRWGNHFDDIKYADDEIPNGDDREMDSRKSEKSESLSDFRDKDLGYIEELETRLPPGRRTISTKSSLSHLSDREVQSSGSSEDRLRKGVLEEIDSDEFFLRQKGISQEDIDMGKYLTDEIREAFRSPVKNALAQLDYDYDDMDIENIDPKTQITQQPNRPGRSLRKKSTTSRTSGSDTDLRYRTYPPSRPQRKSRSQSKSALNEEGVISEIKPRYENDVLVDKPRYENQFNVEPTRYENIPYADDGSEYYKSPGSVKEYEHYKVPRKDAPVIQPTPIKRKSSSKDKVSNKKKNEDWVEVEIETSVEEYKEDLPPQPLVRRKSRKSLDKKQKSTEEWVQEVKAQVVEDQITTEPDYIIPADPSEKPDMSPVPPKRTRSLSRESKSLRSFVSEPREPEENVEEKSYDLSKEKDIQPKQEDIEPIEEKIQSLAETKTVETVNVTTGDAILDDDASYGYATVEKTSTFERPERHKKAKPARPPPPRKKRDVSSPMFNTLPRSVPTRPMRNYSTLGPSRPPRKERTHSVEHIYAEEKQSEAYVEIDDPQREWRVEDNKDLQTEEVIEKMKGRPLPPPPRPPRQKSRGPEDFDNREEDKIALAALNGEIYPIETQEIAAFIHEPPSAVEIVEEVTVSTQTDPLPEDFCLEGEEDADVIQEFSHEQLRIQEAFLEEMKKEEERLQKDMEYRRGKLDSEHSDVIKHLEEIIAEEREIFEERVKVENQLAEDRKRQKEVDDQNEQKILEEKRLAEEQHKLQQEEERKKTENSIKESNQAPNETQPKKKILEVADVDLGYASLDRRERKLDETIPAGPSTGAIPRKSKPIPQPPIQPQPESPPQSQTQPQPQLQPEVQAQVQVQSSTPPQSQFYSQPPPPPPTPTPPPQSQVPVPVPVYVPVVPDPNSVVEVLKTEKLQVKELEVERLNVHELHAANIHVNNLQSNRLNIEDINSRAGNLAIGNIELPPDFIRQILARIPWEELRPPQESAGLPLAPTPASTPVDSCLPNFPPVNVSIPQMRPPRRHHGAKLSDSEEENSFPISARRTYRRHHSSRQHSKHSSDEEDEDERRDIILRRHTPRGGFQNSGILDLSRQLMRACTSAGVRTVGDISAQVRAHLHTEEKSRYYQTVLCIVLVLIAGFFLLGFDSKNVHHYHWDFQFPPQPPKQV